MNRGTFFFFYGAPKVWATPHEEGTMNPNQPIDSPTTANSKQPLPQPTATASPLSLSRYQYDTIPDGTTGEWFQYDTTVLAWRLVG